MLMSKEMGSTSKPSTSINKTITANGNGIIEGDGATVKSLSNIVNECIVVLTYPPDLHNDFRRSMQNMHGVVAGKMSIGLELGCART
ncbi:hypothetical protein Gohar_019754 [Gossypium harknessii]|uniref:Uncharacterized protein n=1 Tax=Gossypium harknessii TaxID=34285 RepID=A0A7J9IB40_9ROSI|nr:hypothetical protein [Gossypium harknessii]